MYQLSHTLKNTRSSLWRRNWRPIKVLYKKIWFSSFSISPAFIEEEHLAQSCLERKATLHTMPDEGCTHLAVPIPIYNFWHHCLNCVGTLFPCLSELECSGLFTLKYLGVIQWELLKAPNSFPFGILHCREQLGIVIYVVVWISTDDHCEPDIMLRTKKSKFICTCKSLLPFHRPRINHLFWQILLQKNNRMFKMHILILLNKQKPQISSPINSSCGRSFWYLSCISAVPHILWDVIGPT